MTKVITFVNQKGDMGKRITAGNLGTGLTRQGKKILLIDDEGIGLRLANIHLDTMEVSLVNTIYSSGGCSPGFFR